MSSHAHEDTTPTVGPKVLSVSTVSPKVRTIAVVRPSDAEANYLAATKTGLGITLRHFAKNLFGRRRSVAQLNQTAPVIAATGFGKVLAAISPINDIETVQYPEEKVVYPERFRGLHRLMQRDDGQVRCVACMCCPTVCPANCITIIPAQTDDKGIEKFPAVFEIDELRCVVCGLCVEACPCDAIRMDSGVHAKPVEERGHAIMTKDLLLAVSKDVGKAPNSTATQGGVGSNWRDKH
jgi:formate hydrogenlyase subunit 6/NADH:ubiquinone oxidoreductase subunit I